MIFWLIFYQMSPPLPDYLALVKFCMSSRFFAYRGGKILHEYLVNFWVLLWSVAPPDLVDFGVSVMGSEVVKKHQKAQHSSELNNRFSVVMSSREKAPKSTT